MATRQLLGITTFDATIDRLVELYAAGHRLVVSFSAGKDSTCVLECAIIAARLTNRLPVEVVMQDEEINFPGTYEYAERVAQRPEVSFNWIVMNHAMVNCFNKENPYFWVFDPLLPSSKWVRQPPVHDPKCNVQIVREKEISMMTIPSRFPPPEGKTLFAVIGLRATESRGRLYGYFSSGGHLTKPNAYGVRGCRPIADWSDGDVWKAIGDNKWDYNKAYDTFMTLGAKRHTLRIAPPTMTAAGIAQLGMAAQAWPEWFDRVAERLPGVRTAAMFGRRSVTPTRQLGETWEECYQRECITNAPKWIADRAIKFRKNILSAHTRHATTPLPEIKPCRTCSGARGCWKNATKIMAFGDPFGLKCGLGWIEHEFFRPGSGTCLGGTPEEPVDRTGGYVKPKKPRAPRVSKKVTDTTGDP